MIDLFGFRKRRAAKKLAEQQRMERERREARERVEAQIRAQNNRIYGTSSRRAVGAYGGSLAPRVPPPDTPAPDYLTPLAIGMMLGSSNSHASEQHVNHAQSCASPEPYTGGGGSYSGGGASSSWDSGSSSSSYDSGSSSSDSGGSSGGGGSD